MPESKGNSMVSTPVSKIPTDPVKRDAYLQEVLNRMYQDIATLFATATDNDLTEKKRRGI